MWKSFKEQTRFVQFAIIIIVIGLLIYLFATTIKPFIEGLYFWNKTDYEQSGQIGDFVAGVVGTLFAFAGTILIICEHLFKDPLREQLPCPADGTVPGQRFIDIIAQKVEYAQPHTAMLDQLAVAGEVFEIAHRTEPVEYRGIDALLARIPIEVFGQGIQEVEVQYLFQPSVEIVVGDSLAQPEIVEELFLVDLFSLHS
jgi:hypothetical protein